MALFEPSVLLVTHQVLHVDRDILRPNLRMLSCIRFSAFCLGDWVLPCLPEYCHTLPYLEGSHWILLGACPTVDLCPHLVLPLFEPCEDAGLVSSTSYPQTDSVTCVHRYQGLSPS